MPAPALHSTGPYSRSVNIIFVNYKGERSTLRAEVGKTLAHAVVDNKWPWMDGASWCGWGQFRTPLTPPPPPTARAAGVTSKSFRYTAEGDWFEPTFGEGA